MLAVLDLELSGRHWPAGATVGARLAALRRIRGVGQRQLAAQIGVSQPTLVALERTAQGRLAILEAVLTVLDAGPALHPRGARRGFYAQVGNGSLNHGWTTPAPLLEKLYAVFGGGFDLDPCSPTANRRRAPVKARVYFTAADDGLALSWTGRVFVNPPYGRPLKLWVAKGTARGERGAGVVRNGTRARAYRYRLVARVDCRMRACVPVARAIVLRRGW